MPSPPLNRNSGAGDGFLAEEDSSAGANLEVAHDLYYDRVVRYLGYRIDQSEVDGATQDVFEQALRSREAFVASRSGLLDWLFGIARHVVSRRARTYRRRSAGEVVSLEASDSWVESDIAARMALVDALDQLPPTTRDLIERRYLLGQTNREIAHTLGFTEAKVAKQIERGLKALRVQLQEDGVQSSSTHRGGGGVGTVRIPEQH